jgi:general secretion pathway protein G
MIPGRSVQSSAFRVQGRGIRAQIQRLWIQKHTLNHEPSTLNQRGFTFIEIMIVLVIIGILVTLAQPSFSTSVQRAREATLQENLFIFRDVIDQYFADHDEYPPTLEALVEARYLRKIPKDPLTGSDATWLLVYATNDDGVEEGIFDVKSGSESIAMDGTRYESW